MPSIELATEAKVRASRSSKIVVWLGHRRPRKGFEQGVAGGINQIDMRNRIAWTHADQAKGGKTIRMPLNDDAMVVIRQQIGKHHNRVFTYRGEPVEKIGTPAFKAAVKRAGLSNFRSHDLCHCWASWHAQSGTPLQVLQELGEWSDYRMVQRYAHLMPEHLAEHANRVSGITKSLQSDNVTGVNFR
jgi:integrase